MVDARRLLAILGDAEILAPELADTAQDIARFRNLLVHGYAAVDDTRVAQIVGDRRGDLRAIAARLAAVTGE